MNRALFALLCYFGAFSTSLGRLATSPHLGNTLDVHMEPALPGAVSHNIPEEMAGAARRAELSARASAAIAAALRAQIALGKTFGGKSLADI
eukprot:CAMPEP_0176300822 /NCGR_PEP_ID=MMETSP0121_2-20121125/60528_1 /TAXON_ID=160619 /ORGANISM="Kryptoperidinium foliaceum, Strain CCMP 1326" /LENGTH=91 /DNA_ID=CAMNT_0017642239 /DNA_START=49 /DNA_END=324 /DNA_ORIENTATION=-